MSLYEVAFEVILEQAILVEAESGKAAMAAVKRGEYEVMDCESVTSSKPRRNWTVEKIGDRNEWPRDGLDPATRGRRRGSADNSVVIHEHPDYGEMTASTLTPDDMARAVLDALEQAGHAKWGLFRKTDPLDALAFEGRDEFPTKEDAQNYITRGFLPHMHDILEPRSRIVGPWTAVEG